MVYKDLNITVNMMLYLDKDLTWAFGSGYGKDLLVT